MRLIQLVTYTMVMSFVILTSINAYSQEAGGPQPSGQAISFHMGPLLPSGLTVEDEIMHSVGGRYGYPLGSISLLEAGFTGSNSAGVKYQNIDLSIRGDIPFRDLFVYGLVGPDFLRLKKPGSGKFSYYVGGHVGGGLLAHLFDTLFLRMELRFNFQPGSVLFFGFGFEYRFGGGGGG